MTYDPRTSEIIRRAIQGAERPIALGWDVLRKARSAAGAHLTDKEIFLAGAGFLFDAIIHSFTKDSEPTEEDLALLTKIHSELCEFHIHFDQKLRE